MNYIIITKKIWNKKNFETISKNIKVLNKINLIKIKKINPKIIFFIHWSKYIKKNIYKKYLCIQFHASDLPKGKGGSPIQNQILLGIKKTKLTAFKIDEKLDSGLVCLKSNLNLNGRAVDIYKNIEKTSIKMIKMIIGMKKIKFLKQNGNATFFKRRKKYQSKFKFNKFKSINKLYDFLRMLDAPSYPHAYTDIENFRITFNNIKKTKKLIQANAIIKKNEK